MQKPFAVLLLGAAIAFSGFTLLVPAHRPGDAPLSLTLPLSPQGTSTDSALVDSATYIPLQTTPECKLGSINKVYCTSTGILVADFSQNSVFLFSNEGQFIRKLTPGQYHSLNDMVYAGHQLLVWDYSTRKLFTYDEQLTLVSSQQLPASTGFFIMPFGNKLLFKGEMGIGAKRNTQLLMVDRQSALVTDSLLKPKPMSKNRYLPTTFNLVTGNEYAYYQPYADNRLFRIDRAHYKLDTLFHLDYPQQYQLEHYLAGVDYMPDNTTDAFLHSANIIAIDGMQQWGNYLYLSYYFRSVRYHLVVNLLNNNTKCFITHPGERLEPHFMESAILGSFDHGLLGAILPDDFVHYRLRTKKTLSPDANPVVAKFYFKDAALQ